MTVPVDLLILESTAPQTIIEASTVFQTANRLRRLASRPDAFSIRAIGPGAARARSLLGNEDVARPPKLVVMPGFGNATDEEMAQRLRHRDVGKASEMLSAFAAGGIAVAAACSSVFVLAATGLLVGRRATTSWWLEPLFRQMYPQVQLEVASTVVADGSMTTAGPAPGHLDLGLVDFGLTLIAEHADEALAEACARDLLLDRRTTQACLASLTLLTRADARIARAERWALDRLNLPITMTEMSAAAALTPRTFARRLKGLTGLTPARLVQRMRAERAVRLIETTHMPFEDVARSVGYADVSTLRRVVRGHTGQTLGALRQASASPVSQWPHHLSQQHPARRRL